MMVVLLAALKILAVLILLVVLLVVVALLLPLGFSVAYRPGHLRVDAVYGPLHRTVWSRKLHRPTMSFAPRTGEKPPEASPQQEAAAAPEAAPRQAVPEQPVTPKEPLPQGAQQAESAARNPEKASAPPMPEEEEEIESGAVMKRLERMLEVTVEDPKAMARCVLSHMRWLRKHSLFKIHVRHLNVFWTVTCEDASRTAVVYGAEMAAFNTALAFVQQTVLLQSDRLWLEPDFLGNRRAERRISCTVSASAILMFHLLYRIWKDPLLQPVPQSESQTT